MGATTKHSLRFPDATDQVDVSGDMKELADDCDAAIPVIKVGTTAPTAAEPDGTIYLQIV